MEILKIVVINYMQFNKFIICLGIILKSSQIYCLFKAEEILELENRIKTF